MDEELKRKIKDAKKTGDWNKCISICRNALAEIDSSNKSDLYSLKLNLALALLKEKDENGQNLKESIKIYEEILCDFKTYSDEWGEAHRSLGYAHSINKYDDRDDNLLKSIRHYECSLHVIKKAKNPLLWASIHAEIGHSYIALKKGKRSNNIKLSISHFNKSLTVFTQEKYPEEWQEMSNALKELT
jgi:tetratricopeptide (TPR) repeat protein